MDESRSFNSYSDDGSMLQFKKLSKNARTPFRASGSAAGFDLFSAESKLISPQDKAIVKTDIAIQLPMGTYGRISPRSGLAAKNFIDVAGGVIDQGYRGAIGVILVNHNTEAYQVIQGQRIAQLIIEKICMPRLVEVQELNESQRGVGSFGSTGE